MSDYFRSGASEVKSIAVLFPFTWSVHRPHTVIGKAIGNAMNMGTTLAVYATLCRETGRPFAFPGSAAQWSELTDMTDAGQLARQLLWAAETEAAHDQAFNIVNGDVFRWQWMWARIAKWFGSEAAPFDGTPQPLGQQMADDAALFSDEQNMFAATVAYALPQGSRTLLDRIADPSPNGNDALDRMHVHFGPGGKDPEAFAVFMATFAETLAADPALLRVRLHLPEAYDNAAPAPPAPDVTHTVPPERERLAILDLTFATPLARRRFFASDKFVRTVDDQKQHIGYVTAFAVSGMYTYVRDKELTLAGLRGSRPAQLIEQLGTVNQTAEDVRHPMLTGTLD